MNKYWFKPKKYGWGTYPITWQGWLATFCVSILCVIAFFISVPIIKGKLAATFKDWLRFSLDVIILTTLFLIVFKDRIDGELKWRWGKE